MSGRKFLFLLLVAFLLSIFFLFRSIGMEATWKLWNIPTMEVTFADLHSVLTGLDAARLGLDPVYENPLDFYGRPVTYPRLWLALGWLKLTSNHTELVAFSLLTVYVISLFIGLKEFSKETAVWMFFIIISPTSMLCYERGNIDLVIFILYALSLALARYSWFWVFAILELAMFLKFFPIVGLGYFLKEKRKMFLRLVTTGVAIFALYISLTWQDSLWMLSHAQKGAIYSYGVSTIGIRVNELTGSRYLSNLATVPLFILIYVLILSALYQSYRFRGMLSEDSLDYIDAFRLGALVYLATFVQGNSFNYRFIFFIFIVPQLVFWITKQPNLRFTAIWTLVVLVISCWSIFLFQFLLVDVGFVLDELLNWTLFVGLLYLFLVSLPSWLRIEINSFFERYLPIR